MLKNSPFENAIICRRDEIEDVASKGCTDLLSIINGDSEEIAFANAAAIRNLTSLRFDDLLSDHPDSPGLAQIEMILAFGDRMTAAYRDGAAVQLAIHCQMGISRSTAAMAIIMAAWFPKASGEEIFAGLLQIRPQAWPNSRLITLADDRLSRHGALSGALPRLYARQLSAYPEIREDIYRHNRLQELDMARSAGAMDPVGG
jgi:predicted protein tyrosine phosphatase